MEPRKLDKSVESGGEGQTAPPRNEERKRRFQIIKLEERIALGNGGTHGNIYTCHHTICCC